MAGAEIFFVKIKGVGGHGAAPHNTVDPVVAAAQIITALQTIPSRNVNPLDSAVVTVGKLTAGTAFNIIPQEAYLEGTVRTFKPEVTEMVNQRLTEIVEHTARAMGCEAEIELIKVTYPVINDPQLTSLISDVVRDADPGAQIDTSFQTMGSEDFSFMMQGLPACFMMVGSANVKKGLKYDHHHPKFNFDEECLPKAVGILAESAIRILKQG
jgi:amidohydrolase